MRKTCIVIVGPTAVGKTDIALRVAAHYNSSIISCDSRQCFCELNIGVAKPSQAELASIPHYFINSHSIHEAVNAATFEQYALEKSNLIFQDNDVVVMAGGTGLYVNAFCNGLDAVPAVSVEIRNSIIADFENNGIEWLQAQLKEKDALFFEKGEMKNPQRMMRALEVMMTTGTSILHFQKSEKKTRDFDIIKIGLELPRPLLNDRIAIRVNQMMKDGLLDEVRSLQSYNHLNALQTVGYREFVDYFENKKELDNSIEEVKASTRQYAKRQMTWFKKDLSIQWCAPEWEEVKKILP